MKSYAKFNGEFGFDESPVESPRNVHETYDMDDDDDGELIICDPWVDYECDGTVIDEIEQDITNYDEIFNLYDLREILDICKKDYEKTRAIISNIDPKSIDETELKTMEQLVEEIHADLYNIDIYVNNPMVYQDNIDIKILVDNLMKNGTIPKLYYLQTILKTAIKP